MTPPIKELLPRLTPVLKNRHEKVQENCIDLVGRIADRGGFTEVEGSKVWGVDGMVVCRRTASIWVGASQTEVG